MLTLNWILDLGSRGLRLTIISHHMVAVLVFCFKDALVAT